jgi:two-component system KDP operon response regulator KdpE
MTTERSEATRVLVVDDEKAIRRFLHISLQAKGYDVSEAERGDEGLSLAAIRHPDLIVLDLGLPDMDGTAFLRHLREWSAVHVIVLSVRERETDKIAALDAGADDYLTKPFSVGELLARMRAVLRRTAPAEEEPLHRIGRLAVDLARRRVTLDDREIPLTPTEYEILRVLVTHRGRILTHTQILRLVWGEGYEEGRHLLRVNMSNLRRKIEPDPRFPRYIFTEPGVGYRLCDGENRPGNSGGW